MRRARTVVAAAAWTLWAGAAGIRAADILNEDFFRGGMVDLSAWNGPRNLARDPTGIGDGSGNGFGLYTFHVSFGEDSSTIATFDANSPNGAANWAVWDSALRDWSVGNGWSSVSGEPWAGYWSDGVNREIATLHGGAGLAIEETVFALEYSVLANAAQTSETYKALIHLTDETGIAGLEFQTTIRSNLGAGGGAPVNRLRIRRMRAPGHNENVEDVAGIGWNGNFSVDITEQNKMEILGYFLKSQYLLRFGPAGSGDVAVEARALTTVGGDGSGSKEWQRALLASVGQYREDSSIAGIADLKRVFISALKGSTPPAVALDDLQAGEHKVGFDFLKLSQYRAADVDGSGAVDNGDLLRILGAVGRAPAVWPEGDVGGNAAVEGADFDAARQAWGLTLGAPAVEPAFPPALGAAGETELIYDPETGNVKLRAAEKILGFLLSNERGQFAAAAATLPFDNPGGVAKTATSNEISNVDLSPIGFSGTKDLGAIMPAGLDANGARIFFRRAYFVGAPGDGEIAFTIVLASAAVTFKRGDPNVDGSVNIADAICVLSYLFGSPADPCKGKVASCRDTADINDDGQVNIADPIALLAHLFARTGPLSDPFATCGVDPKDDSLDCESFARCP